MTVALEDETYRQQLGWVRWWAEQFFSSPELGYWEAHVEDGFFYECEALMASSQFQKVRGKAKQVRDRFIYEREMGIGLN